MNPLFGFNDYLACMEEKEKFLKVTLEFALAPLLEISYYVL